MTASNPYELDPNLEEMRRNAVAQPLGANLYGAVAPSATTAATTAADGAFPVLGAAGLGLSGLGAIVGAVGSAEQHSQDRSDAQQAEGRSLGRQYVQDQISEEERRRRDLAENADYAGKNLDELLKVYGGVNARTGR